MNFSVNPTWVPRYTCWFILLAIVTLLNFSALAQISPVTPNAAQILHQMKLAANRGSVLYIAAHPDDENTRLLSWLVNEKHYRTAYLSLTRGDGGQNLIGSDLREKLGIIRTQELLAARRIDGARQFFTRANDFGFSKHPDETFTVWNKDSILADVVYIIRYFQPDVIITRFSTTPGITHGHHTASAILAEEAFRLAGNPQAFPEQLQQVSVWQPKELYWNTSSWFFRSGEFDTSGLKKIEVGGYNPLLGKSYPEIASLSRSQHRSQGFGSAISRNQVTEWLQPFSGLDSKNWTFPYINSKETKTGAEKKLTELWQQLIREYTLTEPEKSVPQLLRIYELLEKNQDLPQSRHRFRQVKELVAACLGLYAEFVTTLTNVSPGQRFTAKLTVVKRSGSVPVSWLSYAGPSISASPVDSVLVPNQEIERQLEVTVPEQQPTSQPYWLQQAGSLGMFALDNQNRLEQPDNSAALNAQVSLQVGSTTLNYTLPLMHQRVERALGQVTEPLYVIPPVSINPQAEILLSVNGEAQRIKVNITNQLPHLAGNLVAKAPAGWQVSPARLPISFGEYTETKVAEFTLQPTGAPTSTADILQFYLETGEERYSRGLIELSAPHFPRQVYMPPAQVGLQSVKLQPAEGRVAYIAGAGDVVPGALRQLGYTVQEFSAQEAVVSNFEAYKAVVFGIRAFNVSPELQQLLPQLQTYVNRGGVVVVQYNTTPFQLSTATDTLTLGRGRVTNEFAPVQYTEEATTFTHPNKLVSDDWNNWVQERGLYFAESWTGNWQPQVTIADPGEEAQAGALLILPQGKGRWVYCGLSLFRQLPAGVPGAYRLLNNLVEMAPAN